MVRLGLQGGLSISNASISPSTSTSSRSGFAFGPALELGLGANWNLQMEGLYIQKGYKIATVAGEFNYKYDYFEFPILLKYVFDIPIIKPFLEAGPYFAFKLKSETTNSISTITTQITGVKTADIGLGFGGGAEIYISPVSSIFGVMRYELGLTNTDDTTTTSSLKVNSLLLMAGLMIGF